MIARLRGTVVALEAQRVVVDISGVGYRVFITPGTGMRLTVGTEATLEIHTVVREDTLDLYGFLDAHERRAFELLMTVSGIGPKSALSILGVAPTEVLASAIRSGKPASLTATAGIGKKTAEKIVIELKDKVDQLGSAGTTGIDEDALEALRALGLSLKEARDALARVPADVVGEAARVKAALRTLS